MHSAVGSPFQVGSPCPEVDCPFSSPIVLFGSGDWPILGREGLNHWGRGRTWSAAKQKMVLRTRGLPVYPAWRIWTTGLSSSAVFCLRHHQGPSDV